MALIEKIPAQRRISGSDTNPAAYTAKGGGQREAGVANEVRFVVTAVDFEGQKRKSGGNGVLLMSTVVLVGDGGGGGAADAKNASQTNVADHKDSMYTCKHDISKGSPEGECQLARCSNLGAAHSREPVCSARERRQAVCAHGGI